VSPVVNQRAEVRNAFNLKISSNETNKIVGNNKTTGHTCNGIIV
jgi:hypothetical protein